MTITSLLVKLYILDVPTISINNIDDIAKLLKEPGLENLLTKFDFHEIGSAIYGSVTEDIEVRRFALLDQNPHHSTPRKLAELLQLKSNRPYAWADSGCLYYIGEEPSPYLEDLSEKVYRGRVSYIHIENTHPIMIPYVVIKREEDRLPIKEPLHFYMDLYKVVKT